MTPGKKSKRPSKKRFQKTPRRRPLKEASPAIESLPISTLLSEILIPPILLEGDNPPVPLKQNPKPAPVPVTPPEPRPAQPPIGSLPASYDTKNLLLIAQDPHWFYAQWDFNRSDLIRYTQVASDGHLRLRLFKEELAGHPVIEVVVGAEALHQFVPVAEAGVPYLATLGYYLGDGSWVTLCTSEKVATPHDLPSVLNPPPVPAVQPAAADLKSEPFPETQIISQPPVSLSAINLEPATVSEPLLELASIPGEESKPQRPFEPFELTDAELISAEAPSVPPVIPPETGMRESFQEPGLGPGVEQSPGDQPDTGKVPEDRPPLLAASKVLERPGIPEHNGRPALPSAGAGSRSAKPETVAAPPAAPLPPVEVIHQVLQKYLFDFLTPPVSSAERPLQPPEAGPAPQPGRPAPEVLPIPEWFVSGLIPGVSSPQARALPPGPEKEFWFQVNAELVIYGKTMPDAEVKIAGRTIRLRSDGTFSYRFALPDGHFPLPIQATSADGVDTRQARLTFQRQSEYSGQVQAVPQDPGLKPPHPEHL